MRRRRAGAWRCKKQEHTREARTHEELKKFNKHLKKGGQHE